MIESLILCDLSFPIPRDFGGYRCSLPKLPVMLLSDYLTVGTSSFPSRYIRHVFP